MLQCMQQIQDKGGIYMNVKDKLLYAAVITAMGVTMVPTNVYALEQDNQVIVENKAGEANTVQTTDETKNQVSEDGDKKEATVKISLNYEKIGGLILDRNGQEIKEDFTVKKGESVTLQFHPRSGYVNTAIFLNEKETGETYNITFVANEDTMVGAHFDRAEIKATLDKSSKDFGDVNEGYKKVKAQQIILTNTGNDYMLVKKPTSKNYEIGAMGLVGVNIPAELKDAKILCLEPGEALAFDVRPKDGLKPGKYNEKLSIMVGFDDSEAVKPEDNIKTVGATLALDFEVKAAKKVADGNIPQTGDDTPVGLLAAMLAMSGLGIVELKRRNKVMNHE